MNLISLKPIGIIHSPFQELTGMPVQPTGAKDFFGSIEVFSEFEEELADIEGFSQLILLYHFQKSSDYKLKVKPFLDENSHGVFATRAPKRPNSIGISIVELIERTNNVLKIKGVDVLDQTPLIDIKPYVPFFDQPDEVKKVGWLENKGFQVKEKRSDDRFV